MLDPGEEKPLSTSLRRYCHGAGPVVRTICWFYVQWQVEELNCRCLTWKASVSSVSKFKADSKIAWKGKRGKKAGFPYKILKVLHVHSACWVSDSGDIKGWAPLRRHPSHGCTGSGLLTGNSENKRCLFMECRGAILIFLSKTCAIFSLAINSFHVFCFDHKDLKLDSFLTFEKTS